MRHGLCVDVVRGFRVKLELVQFAEIVFPADAAVIFDFGRRIHEFRLSVFVVGASGATTVERVHRRPVDLVLVWGEKGEERRILY